jgi:hypothetical protein
MAIDFQTTLRYYAFKGEGKRRVHSGSLFDTGVQILQSFGLLPGYISGQTAFSCGVIDLFFEFGERRRIFEKMIQDGAGQDTGRIRTGHDVRVDPGRDESMSYPSINVA